jgi:hypothetical protein
MGNYALQKGPCSFLNLSISPREVLFPFLLCSSSLFFPGVSFFASSIGSTVPILIHPLPLSLLRRPKQAAPGSGGSRQAAPSCGLAARLQRGCKPERRRARGPGELAWAGLELALGGCSRQRAWGPVAREERRALRGASRRAVRLGSGRAAPRRRAGVGAARGAQAERWSARRLSGAAQERDRRAPWARAGVRGWAGVCTEGPGAEHRRRAGVARTVATAARWPAAAREQRRASGRRGVQGVGVGEQPWRWSTRAGSGLGSADVDEPEPRDRQDVQSGAAQCSCQAGRESC